MGLRFKHKKIKPTKEPEENMGKFSYNFGLGYLSN